MKTVLFVWILGGVAAWIYFENWIIGGLLGTLAYVVVVNCSPVDACLVCDGKKRFMGMFDEGWVWCPGCDGSGTRLRMVALWDGHWR